MYVYCNLFMMLEMSHKYEAVEDITHTRTSKKLEKSKERSLVSNIVSKTPIIDAMNDLPEKSSNKASDNTNKVIEITSTKEYEKFKRKYSRCVVFYGAEWCHACKDIQELYARIANRYCKRVAMAHVDIDVAHLDFTHVPVFVALRHGKQIDSIEGADRTGLRNLVKKAITAE